MADEIKKSEVEEMTPEERLLWLRERGVMVETSEERKRKQITNIMNEKDEVDGESYIDVTFVHVPHDETLPLKELTMKVSEQDIGKGDLMLEYLKPFFSAQSQDVDLNLFQDQAAKHFGSSESPGQVSERALKEVANQGQVEAFCLVQPMPSNKSTSVNIYLDEIGMLKRLSLNARASDFALRAGFNPAPKFYGDVYMGRVSNVPVVKNENFKLGADTSPNAKWLETATMENLEYQTMMNKISGTSSSKQQFQPSADGEDGIAKAELGGLYSWTQTDEEVEINVPLSSENGPFLTMKEVKAGGLKVKYFPRKMNISFDNKEILELKFYATVDPDGCMWTLDSDGKGTSVVVTCEKNDCVSWPRITE